MRGQNEGEKMEKKLEYDRVCKSCDGTGLYIGMGERDGAAVICHSCKGTGCEHIIETYQTFEGRKDYFYMTKRVFRVNPGICIGGPDLSIFGGMPIKEWALGLMFPKKSEDRLHTCPAWFYQSADYKKKPDWDECLRCGTFSSCDNFGMKSACWIRWDKENKL